MRGAVSSRHLAPSRVSGPVARGALLAAGGFAAILLLAACGVKGPPRAPGAETPPATFETQRCLGCRVVEPEDPALEDAEETGVPEGPAPLP